MEEAWSDNRYEMDPKTEIKSSMHVGRKETFPVVEGGMVRNNVRVCLALLFHGELRLRIAV